ncbi:unnamed protein product, partial [Ilex paraguariensis]
MLHHQSLLRERISASSSTPRGSNFALFIHTVKFFPGVFYHGKVTAVIPIIGRILPFFAKPAFWHETFSLMDDIILAWKSSFVTSCPKLAALLKGYTRAVLSLLVGANRLCLGSMDKTMRVWDLQTLQCIQILNGHADVVMSVLYWDSFLLSGPLDSTIKVWAATESGNLEVVYEHNEEHTMLMPKPILLCSCNDNTVSLYDLPILIERGRIYAKLEGLAIQIGHGGLFFTGEATRQLFVRNCLA